MCNATDPPSEQTILVTLALAADTAAWRHGYELCQQTGDYAALAEVAREQGNPVNYLAALIAAGRS